jgi:ArsR family transcriptional regulator
LNDQDGYSNQAQIFRALSHPVRLRILDVLAHREACVCHLTAILGQRQPYVSQQLASLREAGLVADRREGTLIYYRLSDERLATVLDQGKLAAQGIADDSLVFEPVPVEKVADCPCPHCQGDG